MQHRVLGGGGGEKGGGGVVRGVRKGYIVTGREDVGKNQPNALQVPYGTRKGGPDNMESALSYLVLLVAWDAGKKKEAMVIPFRELPGNGLCPLLLVQAPPLVTLLVCEQGTCWFFL